MLLEYMYVLAESPVSTYIFCITKSWTLLKTLKTPLDIIKLVTQKRGWVSLKCKQILWPKCMYYVSCIFRHTIYVCVYLLQDTGGLQHQISSDPYLVTFRNKTWIVKMPLSAVVTYVSEFLCVWCIGYSGLCLSSRTIPKRRVMHWKSNSDDRLCTPNRIFGYFLPFWEYLMIL